MGYAVLDGTGKGGFNSSNNTVSFNITISGKKNRYLIVGVMGRVASGSSANLPIASANINGVPLINSGLSVPFGTSDALRLELWYLFGNKVPKNGTYTVTITFSGNIDKCSAVGAVWYRLAGQAPEASGTQTQEGGTNGTPISRSTTSITDRALVVSFFGEQDGAGFISIGASENTAIFNVDYIVKSALSYEQSTTPGGYTTSFDDAFGQNCAMIVAILKYRAISSVVQVN